MKNRLLTFGMVGLTGVLLPSFALMQKRDEAQESKKSRHIKITKIENGKKMELDTVLTGDDVFVWNGDTISPAKHIKKFNRADFDKMHRFDVRVDSKDGNENVTVFKHRGGKKGEPMIWNMDSGDDVEIVTEDCDSLGKKVVIRKIMKGGDGNHMTYFNDLDLNGFPPPPPPPMPPVPPVPPIPHMKMGHSGQIIDLDDPNIISFKKKEMSGDREKIEIIRKKSGDTENISFNFQPDDEPMPPEAPDAPDAPEFNWESKGDSLQMHIIEKKVIKRKNGKEIEVKVEAEENK